MCFINRKSECIKDWYQYEDQRFLVRVEYCKPCLERTLKNRQNKDLNDNGSLMKVKSIAECSSAIRLHCIKE